MSISVHVVDMQTKWVKETYFSKEGYQNMSDSENLVSYKFTDKIFSKMAMPFTYLSGVSFSMLMLREMK